MSQPLFSDDEDSQRFSKQLQGLNIVSLLPADYVPSASGARAANKENAAWRANGRTKDENDSGDDYSFTASPSKSVKRPGRLVLSDNADPENETAPGSPHTDVTPALSPFTPKKEEEADEDEWAEQDGQQTPDETRTPRNAGASTKRRRMLRKIKIGMAEQAEAAQRDGIDMDFVFVGEDTPIAPTPFRLRSSGRHSRVSYRNMDWSHEKTDRQSKRRSGPLFDESEEDRVVAREWEMEREQRRKKVQRKRKKGEKGTPTTVPGSGFSLSDDEPLATVAKRMRVEQEGGREEGRASRKRKDRGERITSITVSDEWGFSISDDETLLDIARELKLDKKRDKRDKAYHGWKGKKEGEDGAGEYQIKRRQR
ncbi:hypothetical protein PRIPAC_84426 [Pristionchus pacificus]|uniref:Uncharacterized protein n=1 Tax=Pristionchus pacificus TaxID=54126 RepID=A0A2A6BN61_PRIPA|nr:hypothetical protein PRIPAC_84426 [Pristionchus pacificus]|eukprot:PDM67233.1 hypothetical protein PRIPAC_48650 [Pristionchus pacificus]